jgi:nucleoid DNA-binding protein
MSHRSVVIQVAALTGVPESTVTQVIDSLYRIVLSAALHNEIVRVEPFGEFTVSTYKAHSYKLPRADYQDDSVRMMAGFRKLVLRGEKV